MEVNAPTESCVRILLCSFTLNNVRLLYLSKIGTPYDPATEKGTLGRHLTHQVEGGIRIFFDQPLNAFMGAGSLGRRISDFDGDNGLAGDNGLLRYGMLSLNGNGDLPIGAFERIPPDASKSNWGAEWKAASLKWHDRVTQFNMYGEHMSYRQNYIDLDPTYTTNSAIHCRHSRSIGPSTSTSNAISPTILRLRLRRRWVRGSTPGVLREPNTM